MTDTLRQRYLDAAALQKMGSLQIKARTLVEGIIAGMHRSPHKGGSVEFSEYIEYTAGQELRHVDWKVYAKSDKYYVKQYEDETNLQAYFVLDGSGSMDFQGEDAPVTKLEYVRLTAAALAYLFLRQGDAVGGLSFDEKTRQFLPASSRKNHLDDLFYLFEQMPGRGTTSLGDALRTIAERARSRSLILMFSDFLDADQDTMDFIRVLRKRRYDVALFHVLDEAEVTLPYEGLTIFEGLEGEDDLLVDPDDLRDAYNTRMREHLDWVEHQCREGDVGYQRFLTSDPLEEVCLRYLRGRL
ncbi:MAG: DUF58 domain-containing protein [Bradymonadaceae bacterium]